MFTRHAYQTHTATAAASLRNRIEDLSAIGLHVLAGRYMGRRWCRDEDGLRVALEAVMVIRVRRHTEEPGFTIDRRSEPKDLSEVEEVHGEDD